MTTPDQPQKTRPIDDDTFRLVRDLADLNAHIAKLTADAEAIKTELRARCEAGDYVEDGGRTVLKIVPTRKFDVARALELVPEPLREACYTTAPDPAKVKEYLAPALVESCMVVNGKPKVVL
jgi:hypothetical protein